MTSVVIFNSEDVLVVAAASTLPWKSSGCDYVTLQIRECGVWIIAIAMYSDNYISDWILDLDYDITGNIRFGCRTLSYKIASQFVQGINVMNKYCGKKVKCI